MTGRPATVFGFPSTMADEGAREAVARIADAGLDGISLAGLYHDGRDVLPHNPRARIVFQEDGAALFGFAPGEFPDGTIQPIRSQRVDGTGPFEEVLDAARDRGLSVIAWAVFLHNTSLGRRNPEAVSRTVFGDPQLTSLCPANPRAADYAVGVASALAARGVDAVNAEGLHFLPLEHGYHHERYFLNIGPIDRLLFGLCFCEHCVRAARTHGVDTEALIAGVRTRLQRVLETEESYDPAHDGPSSIDGLWHGELGAYLRSREATVTALAGRVHDALRERSVRFIFNDPAGALPRPPEGEPDESWRLGIDPAALGAICDEVQMLAYSADPGTVARDAAGYQERIGSGTPLRVGLRPMWPDCDSADNLRQKLEAVRASRATAADFYAYDFMRLSELGRLADALSASGWKEKP